jgi:hypothetical protein
VLHDWSDEDCIKILKRCKEAIIPSRAAGGKIIILDVVVGSSSEAICQGTQQLFDLIISVTRKSGARYSRRQDSLNTRLAQC